MRPRARNFSCTLSEPAIRGVCSRSLAGCWYRHGIPGSAVKQPSGLFLVGAARLKKNATPAARHCSRISLTQSGCRRLAPADRPHGSRVHQGLAPVFGKLAQYGDQLVGQVCKPEIRITQTQIKRVGHLLLILHGKTGARDQGSGTRLTRNFPIGDYSSGEAHH